jgi:hypothetical protein
MPETTMLLARGERMSRRQPLMTIGGVVDRERVDRGP